MSANPFDGNYFPGYNYLGPFTKNEFGQKKPVNYEDYVAMYHDRLYAQMQAEGLDPYHGYNNADRWMVSALNSSPGTRGRVNKLAVRLLKAKMLLGPADNLSQGALEDILKNFSDEEWFRTSAMPLPEFQKYFGGALSVSSAPMSTISYMVFPQGGGNNRYKHVNTPTISGIYTTSWLRPEGDAMDIDIVDVFDRGTIRKYDQEWEWAEKEYKRPFAPSFPHLPYSLEELQEDELLLEEWVEGAGWVELMPML